MEGLMKTKIIVPVFVLVLLILGFSLLPSSKNEIPYPEGYRNWTHIKTMVIKEGHPLYQAFGGIHHIYANEKALEGYKSENKFKDGSVIVFDLLEFSEENNAIVEGKRKVVGVMLKDSKKYKQTGGWGFEGFAGDTKERVVKNMEGECFACHTQVKEKDFVFSEYRK